MACATRFEHGSNKVVGFHHCVPPGSAFQRGRSRVSIFRNCNAGSDLRCKWLVCLIQRQTEGETRVASPKECWYLDQLLTPKQADGIASAQRGDFLCPECYAPLRVSIGNKTLKSGLTMVDHFEHWERNANCSLSTPPKGVPHSAAAKHRADVALTATEGRSEELNTKAYSRERKLVRATLVAADFKCAACSFRLAFENKFVIECHHKVQVKHGTRVSSVNDLLALCPTCHSIAHLQDPPMDLAQIRQVLKRATRG